MKIFNNLVAAFLPYFPKFIIHPFAKPYVAGVNMDDAISRARELNQRGFQVTIDILGEHVHTQEEADNIRNEYLELLSRIQSDNIDGTISFKLTHLGLELDRDLAFENSRKLVDRAQKLDIPVTIDMENSPYTDSTLSIYRNLHGQFNKVGTVLQAYLFRSRDDIEKHDNPEFHVRICKGIYRESPEIAIQDRQEIRGSFVELVKTILTGDGFAAIATHDQILIDDIEQWIEDNNIPKDRFEFQVLYGVPMGNRLERLKKKGYAVRVYLPFGEAWFDYAIRRLKENPDMAGYIIGNLFKRRTSN